MPIKKVRPLHKLSQSLPGKLASRADRTCKNRNKTEKNNVAQLGDGAIMFLLTVKGVTATRVFNEKEN